MSAPLLELQDLRVGLSSPPHWALVDGASIRVRRGRSVGLLGESGSGKTLCALAVMGLLPDGVVPTGGRICFDGQPIAAGHLLRGDRMTMVFQEPTSALNPVLSVGEQVAEALHRRMGRSIAWRRAVAALAEVGIAEPEARARGYPHELSGGMRQRVLLAMALVVEPALLIADEPTTAVDVTVQHQLLSLIRTQQRERGLSVVLITHDLGVVGRACDEVAVMYAGQVVEWAPVPAFLRAPRHPYSAALLRALPDGSKRPLVAIPGAVPPPGARPEGCAFRGRCHRARPECAAERPKPQELGPEHWVACFDPEPPHGEGRG